MRRLAAASMLLVLLSLWSAPLFVAMSAGAQRNLPLCCRRNGRHHCMGQTIEQPVSGTVVSAPHEKCPVFPKSLMPRTAHTDLFAQPAGAQFYAAVLSHPAVFAQTEALYRISNDRSRRKRGPPANL